MEKISIIIPSYNEESNIEAFFELCKKSLDNKYSYEFIYVNDGSKDNTLEEIKKLINNNPQSEIIGINFSRNFGKESAIFAGLNHASGAYITLIDADLQQHPKYVNEMVQVLEHNEDIDMVACYQDKRKESKLLTKFKDLFYYLINKVSNTKFEKNASDFRTFRKNVSESIKSLDEYHRFSKGLFAWVGFNVHYMPYTVEERLSGASSWSFLSLTKYAFEGFLGYSVLPLKIATVIGLITSFAAVIYFIYILVQKIFIGIDLPGYATIVSLILLLSGIQLISMGIIGEYLAKTYMEVKERPHYIIKNIIRNEDNENK